LQSKNLELFSFKSRSAMQWGSISCSNVAAAPGLFKLTPAGIDWKSAGTDLAKSIKSDAIDELAWGQYGRHCRLAIYDEEGNATNFDGFSAKDFETFKSFFEKEYQKQLPKANVACSGANWGKLEIFKGKQVAFNSVDGKSAVQFSVSDVSQCALPGIRQKTELEVQFHETDGGARDHKHRLVEMRFHCPSEGSAEELKDQILRLANIENGNGAAGAGDAIVEIGENFGTFQTPRGRYAIDMHASYLRMHGKTYDYKILYKDISRFFLLDKPDDYHTAFVISLDNPLRQGQQTYRHLVMQLAKKEQMDLTVNLEESAFAEGGKYHGKLEPKMSGAVPQLIAKVFKLLTAKKVIIPGAFRSHHKQRGVKCSLKAEEGVLYPLEKSFVFIHKPTLYVRYEDVEFVEFERYAGVQKSASRSFDLTVQLKNQGGEPGKKHDFSGLDRNEYKQILDFLGSKNLKIKNLSQEGGAGGGQNEYAHDPYRAQIEAAGGQVSDADDDDEEDSDFGTDNASGSDSSDESGMDSDASNSGSKKKEKKDKKMKKAKSEDGAKSPKKRSKDSPRKSSKSSKEAASPKAAPPKKRKMKAKDPAAPKRAISSFMLFAKDKRPSIALEHPELKASEVASKMGELWRGLDADGKKEWNDKAEVEKQRYQEEMKDYVPPPVDSDEVDVHHCVACECLFIYFPHSRLAGAPGGAKEQEEAQEGSERSKEKPIRLHVLLCACSD
jgi:structure-specific recognition protein 1